MAAETAVPMLLLPEEMDVAAARNAAATSQCHDETPEWIEGIEKAHFLPSEFRMSVHKIRNRTDVQRGKLSPPPVRVAMLCLTDAGLGSN